MTVAEHKHEHEHLNQADEQELKACVGQTFRPYVANYSGLERFEVDGKTIRCHLYFGPWEPMPAAERLAELVTLFEQTHPCHRLELI